MSRLCEQFHQKMLGSYSPYSGFKYSIFKFVEQIVGELYEHRNDIGQEIAWQMVC